MSGDPMNTFSNLEEISSMLSHQFSENTLDQEQIFSVPDQLGKGNIKRMIIKEGLEVIVSDVELSKDLTVCMEPECQYFEMNFCLAGKTHGEMDERQFKIQEPRSHVYYSHRIQTNIEIKANVRNRTVEIRLSPGRMLRYFENETDKKRVRKMLEDQNGQITSYQLSPMIKRRVFEILQCPYRGMIKNIYIEAKVMELITLFFQEEERHSEHKLETEEIKKLKRAQDIILSCLDEPYSIKELAKKVGLNDFQLKKGFKQLYGTTVFGLIRSQKMEKAAWLMKMEGHNVSETASAVGYSNFSNFTVAFRKHFGCNPSEYLKKQ